MKSALLAAIFAMTGGVAILLAPPAEEKIAAVKFHQARAEEGLPPQIEKEAMVPEPLEQYLVAQAKTKTEKEAPRRYRHVARPRPNFFEKLVVGFINLQKRQPVEKLVVHSTDLQNISRRTCKVANGSTVLCTRLN
jgi:hypothetical protein